MSTLLETLKKKEARAREKVRAEEARLKKLERTRRTRALILAGNGLLALIARGKVSPDILNVLEKNGALRAKERGQDIDYSVYLQRDFAEAKKRQCESPDPAPGAGELEDEFGLVPH